MNDKTFLIISFAGILITLSVIVGILILKTRPLYIETTKIYYAIIENGKVRIEEPEPTMSMGCLTYWRIKGYPCYEIK